MKKWLLALAMFCFFSVISRAQKPELSHQAGVQVNELIRQLLSFGDNNIEVNNPYLFTYSVFEKKCNWGIRGGVGYDYNRFEDKFTAANHESKKHDINYRLGIAKFFELGKRWECTVGADYVNNYIQNKVSSFSVISNQNSFDSTATLSNDITRSHGAGLQLTLGFRISERILLSTEATFYYMDVNAKSNVLISETFIANFNPQQNSYNISVSNSDVSSSEFKMNLPVAIFLNIKF